ncbi:hypothetical protein BDZ94DRAFT_1283697 [Collybia nuda]|uniref:Cytochrome P450 n=1 Tax=Collybia nuda TaxID=64659 RepID=A0A9P5Y252_9AGAR|nr:hypothetical protein BDZ94DRAFT_1283697 [Collybia nuda]
MWSGQLVGPEICRCRLVTSGPLLFRKYCGETVTYCSTDSIIHLFKPPNATPHDLLVSRAIPNARLIRAFALTNTFVSPEQDIHASFVGHAKHLLRAAEKRGWPHFQQVAMQAVDAALPASSLSNFDVFVQDVALRVTLVGLLDVDVDVAELDPGDIQVVAALITQLWALSKKPEPIPVHLLPSLNRHLRRLMTDKDTYPNPLDYVIPVWETLWRVVATTIAHTHRDHILLETFGDLHDHPTLSQFRLFKDQSHPSVEAVISEAMRLHPPSKHIVRATFAKAFSSVLPSCFQRFVPDSSGYVLRECADIGTVLRSSIWGTDAGEFNPSRHHVSNFSEDQTSAMAFVFGYGRHRCVAASWAPMAAAIIVGAIMDRVQDGSDYQVVAGPQIGGREGWLGWSVARR